MFALANDLDKKLANSHISPDFIFGISDVRRAVNKLKAHKHEGGSDLSSDHIINAGDDCFIHTGCLFTAITIHGSPTDNFLHNTIIPIPKGRCLNTADSANFRGIALSLVYGKIFDRIILSRYGDKLMSCDYQLGFKSKSSTNLCSMALKETITCSALALSTVLRTTSLSYGNMRFSGTQRTKTP
jgi:hypothetical protein